MMTDIDIKLLQIFAEIHATRSVSQAALNLGLSQPTVSSNLARLRDHYQDPLFVRASQGLEATGFANELHQQAVVLLSSFDALSKLRQSFDPLTAKRVFRLAMSDLSQIVLLPALLNRLRAVAPGVRIRVIHIDEDTAGLLEAGEADLAVGFMPQLDVGFYQQKLFGQHYVGIAAPGHPRLGSEPSLDAFLGEGHVVVTTSGTGHSVIDRTLRQKSLQRNVVLEVPSYLGLANIVAQTDLIATVPRHFADMLERDGTTRPFELPFDVPTYQIKQHWHERFHQDSAHRWLRSTLTELFLESPAGNRLAG
jgi:DNA-binding transcriptional LysR family regulator